MHSTKIVFAVEIAPKYLETLRREHPGVLFETRTEPRELLAEVHDADGLIIGSKLDPKLFDHAPRLRWLHSFSAGISTLLTPQLVASDVTFTNNRGVRSNNVAEHVIAMMLTFARGLHVLAQNQVQRQWEYMDYDYFELSGQTVGIAGLGSIGKFVARKANCLGMRVIGLKRHPPYRYDDIGEVYGPDGFYEMLRAVDHLAICLPLTPSTYHMFGDAEFEAMERRPYVYNVGRGPLIDHESLVRALSAGQIAGAGLDVTEPEPLPSESPLWDMDQVLVTCHTAQGTPANWERSVDLVSQNIQRLTNGQSLLNTIDKQAGY